MATDGKYHSTCQRRKGTRNVLGYYWTVADVNAVNGTGLTALHLAASNGHIDVLTTLLKHDAYVDATDESGWTALHHAANNDCKVVVRLLTNWGADLNAKTRDRSPLQIQR